MTSNDETPVCGELSDAELSAVLEAADSDLLRHLQSAVHPARALERMLAAGDAAGSAETRTTQPDVILRQRDVLHVIEVKSYASKLRAVCNETLQHIECLRDATPDPSGFPMREVDVYYSLREANTLAVALIRAIVSSRSIAVSRARTASGPGRIDAATRDAVRHLGGVIDQARGAAWDLVDDPPGSAIPTPGGDSLVLHATGDQPRELRDLPASIETFDQVAAENSALLDLLANLPVDASGVDLSRAEVHLDAMEGVMWSTNTTWPPLLADRIRAQSKEIRQGVYQVSIGGASPGRSELIGV